MDSTYHLLHSSLKLVQNASIAVDTNILCHFIDGDITHHELEKRLAELQSVKNDNNLQLYILGNLEKLEPLYDEKILASKIFDTLAFFGFEGNKNTVGFDRGTFAPDNADSITRAFRTIRASRGKKWNPHKKSISLYGRFLSICKDDTKKNSIGILRDSLHSFLTGDDKPRDLTPNEINDLQHALHIDVDYVFTADTRLALELCYFHLKDKLNNKKSSIPILFNQNFLAESFLHINNFLQKYR